MNLPPSLQAYDQIGKPIVMAFTLRTVCGLCLFAAAICFYASSAGTQEKVTVGHSARAALSIGPLLYGIKRGF